MDITPRLEFLLNPLEQQAWQRLLLIGGRASGKSHGIAVAIILWTIKQSSQFTIGFFRQIQKSIDDSMKPLLEQKISEAKLDGGFEIKKNVIVCKLNGIQYKFFGMQDHTIVNVKSAENVRIGVVEEAQTVTKKSIDILEPTITRCKDWKLIYLMNPDTERTPVHVHLNVNTPVNTEIVDVSWKDNDQLSQSAIDEINDFKRRDYHGYLHIYMGKFIEKVENAIFEKDNIEQHRVTNLPELKLVAIGVDPAKKTHKGEGDEWGIVVAGIDDNNHAYVLEDGSGHYSPGNASQKICKLYDKWQAGIVVAEDNVGGNMTRDVIRLANQTVAVKLVTAIVSKRHRANPVAMRYEKGEVHHHGLFNVLEYQQCTWTEDAKYSPDRLDSLVHVLRHLFKIGNANYEVTFL